MMEVLQEMRDENMERIIKELRKKEKYYKAMTGHNCSYMRACVCVLEDVYVKSQQEGRGRGVDSRLHILSSHDTGREGPMKPLSACSCCCLFAVLQVSATVLRPLTTRLWQAPPLCLPGGDSLDPVALLV